MAGHGTPGAGGADTPPGRGSPTRREDLMRLLNSFEDVPAGPGAMSPARLREALRL